MTGLLNFDFFAMRKKVSSYVCLLLPGGFLLLQLFLLRVLGGMDGLRMNAADAFLSVKEIALLDLAVYFVLLLGNDQKKGYIKNIAGSLPNRASYVLSKTVILTCFLILTLAFLTVCSFVGCMCFAKDSSDWSTAAFFRYLLAMTVLVAGMMCLISFVYFLTKSTAGSLVFAVMLSLGMLSSIFYALLELLMKKMDLNPDFMYVSDSLQLQNLSLDMSTKDTWVAIGVGAAYIVVFTTLSCIVFRKKDIT